MRNEKKIMAHATQKNSSSVNAAANAQACTPAYSYSPAENIEHFENLPEERSVEWTPWLRFSFGFGLGLILILVVLLYLAG